MSAPRITIVLGLEAPPRVEIEDGAGATWTRLADWLAASGQADVLRRLLELLRDSQEKTA